MAKSYDEWLKEYQATTDPQNRNPYPQMFSPRRVDITLPDYKESPRRAGI
jgi:hypothetical protein